MYILYTLIPVESNHSYYMLINALFLKMFCKAMSLKKVINIMTSFSKIHDTKLYVTQLQLIK